MKEYNPLKIEKKWQGEWDKKKAFQASDKSKKPKWYSLYEFNYPSGAGLHVGHVRTNTAMDIISRKRRMEGYNVLYPAGWDSFGLPTENYAIKTGISPQLATKQNTKNFKRQMKSIGHSFDWSREIDTSDPKYYKWTQWIFLQMWKKGLAYKKKMDINWCPSCKIGLANEEVVDNDKCERCGSSVEKKEKEQWVLAITKYADRLDKDLDDVDYLPQIKTQQRNWIGKSEGAEIEFKLKGLGVEKEIIKIFTTRPDTLFGVTYVVLAPEHEIISKIKNQIENFKEVEKYINDVKKKPEIERTAENKGKTGIKLKGIRAINPANNEEVPVFIADYVLANYGTGAVMAVPAHDERDFDFAKSYNLPIKNVINPIEAEIDYEGMGQINLEETKKEIKKQINKILKNEVVYMGFGFLRNSGKFDGMDSEKAKKEITKFVGGKWVTKFKLRDWIFSRQRYWGEPIPLIYCEKCGWQPIAEKNLPLILPKVKNYKPTDNGESPLSSIKKWVETKCPKCRGKANRETDTMPNWAGSSWYYLRYLDSKNNKKFADPKKLRYWGQVDWYNGGMEHVTLHLLYSRFWHKFLYDLKLVPNKEPYKKRTAHGMILAENGEKMSKSRGNVINPDDIVKMYGADTLRVYEMFMGPFDQAISWDTNSMSGSRRFLDRVWRLQYKVTPMSDVGVKVSKTQLDSNYRLESLIHKTIKKVSEDIESMKFNTAVSSMMILINEMEKVESIAKNDFEIFLKLLSPFAPHITEEIWSNLGNKKLLSLEKWPKFDPKKIKDDEVTLVIQINGKVRANLLVSTGLSEKEAVEIAQKEQDISKWISGKKIVKIVYISGKILNFVVV